MLGLFMAVGGFPYPVNDPMYPVGETPVPVPVPEVPCPGVPVTEHDGILQHVGSLGSATKVHPSGTLSNLPHLKYSK